jgi:plasmid stabilization system protein ParE
MIRPLVITEQAHSDIERNAVWWAEHHSFEQAVKWKAAVYEQLVSIPQMPESYALAPENPLFRDEIRQKSVGLGRRGYRAVFAVRREIILLLTVRRGAEHPLDPTDVDLPE